MLNSPQAILSAHGQALLQPLGFSRKYRGKMLTEIPTDFWKWLGRESGVDVNLLLKKVEEARNVSTVSNRPVITDLSQVTESLYRHQKKFQIDFGTRNYGAAFFDIGTGKTRTMLEMMRLRWMPGDKALILCPKSVFGSWQREIKAFTPHFSSVTVTGPAAKKRTFFSLRRDIFITNYETLLTDSLLELLLQMGVTWLICDESHKVKSHSAQTTKRLVNFSANVEMRWLMTGTPITNTEADIFTQALIVDRGRTFGTSFSKFYNDYFTKGQFGWYQGEFKQSRDQAFKAAIAGFSMRVLKSECLDLPKVMPDVIHDIELSGEALKYYQEMQKNALIVLKNKEIEAKFKIVEMRRLHQICGGGIGESRFNCDKLDALLDLIESIGKPVVVSAIYRDEIKAIVAALKKAGRRVGHIAGDVSDKDRQARLAAFMAGELDVIVLQQQAAGTGIDGLQRVCSNLVFFSWDYLWENGQQMKGRIDRPGQEDHPQYFYLRAALPEGKFTIDHAIYESHQEKTAKISDLIDKVIQEAEG